MHKTQIKLRQSLSQNGQQRSLKKKIPPISGKLLAIDSAGGGIVSFLQGWSTKKSYHARVDGSIPMYIQTTLNGFSEFKRGHMKLRGESDGRDTRKSGVE